MTEIEALLKFVPGQLIGHHYFSEVDRWRISHVSYNKHRQLVILFVTPVAGEYVTRARTYPKYGADCMSFEQLGQVYLIDEEQETTP